MNNTYKELAREQLKLIDYEIKLLMEIREKAVRCLEELEGESEKDFKIGDRVKSVDNTRYSYIVTKVNTKTVNVRVEGEYIEHVNIKKDILYKV